MLYISPEKASNGAFFGPQSTPARGLIKITSELAEQLTSCGGFASIVVDGDTATSVIPNWDDYEEWKKEHLQETDPPQAIYTPEDILRAFMGD